MGIRESHGGDRWPSNWWWSIVGFCWCEKSTTDGSADLTIEGAADIVTDETLDVATVDCILSLVVIENNHKTSVMPVTMPLILGNQLVKDSWVDFCFYNLVIPLKQMIHQQSRRVDAVQFDRKGEANGDKVKTICLKARLFVWRQDKPQRSIAHASQPSYRRKLSELFVGIIEPNNCLGCPSKTPINQRIGAAFERFQTLRLQKKFDNLGSGVLSYEPCQFSAHHCLHWTCQILSTL